LDSRRVKIAEHRIVELLRDRLVKLAIGERVSEAELSEMARSVADRSRDPYSVVEEIIGRLGISP